MPRQPRSSSFAALFALFACLVVHASSCKPPEEEEPRDPNQCTDVKCNPPPCCGQPAVNGQCCAGTEVSRQGNCIPLECRYKCGGAPCEIDDATCEVTCARPPCCVESCTTDADCCAGTRCKRSVENTMLCYPTGCDSCGAGTSCQVDIDDCSADCKSDSTTTDPTQEPTTTDTCGYDCSTTPCGTPYLCESFPDGRKLCVPPHFRAACNACSTSCRFSLINCDVECVDGTQPSDPPTAVGETPNPTAEMPTEPACTACCQPCTDSSQCCSGLKCNSEGKCTPLQCGYCDYGCKYYCPE